MSDEQRIDAAEHDREYGHLDPAGQAHVDDVQTRYERSLGWTHD